MAVTLFLSPPNTTPNRSSSRTAPQGCRTERVANEEGRGRKREKPSRRGCTKARPSRAAFTGAAGVSSPAPHPEPRDATINPERAYRFRCRGDRARRPRIARILPLTGDERGCVCRGGPRVVGGADTWPEIADVGCCLKVVHVVLLADDACDADRRWGGCAGGDWIGGSVTF